MKYSKLFFYDCVNPEIPPKASDERQETGQKPESTIEATRFINMNPTRLEGAPYMDFAWLWKGSSNTHIESEHFHDFDEFVGFLGTNGPQDPDDLGGEIEFWLGGEKYTITKSCLIYIPKGLKHCPIRFNRIDTPVLFFSGSFDVGEYTRTSTEFTDSKAAERNYSKYFSYTFKPLELPPNVKQDGPPPDIGSKKESSGVLNMNSIDGAPYIQFAWLYSGSDEKPHHPEHAHSWGEIFGHIGFTGQEDPYGPMGEIEFWINGEKHVITKSCLVWMPPDIPHCPVRFARIDKPILWFTLGVGMKSGDYDFSKPPADKKD